MAKTDNSHKKISIIIAIITSTVGGISVYISKFIITYPWFYLIMIVLISFTIVYVVTIIMLQSFIRNKIHPIYKLIHNDPSTIKKKIEDPELWDGDLLKLTQEEVLQWISKKQIEIQKLQDIESYRKEYVGNVAHELKTPIFSIQGYISTLLDGGIHDQTINVKYLEKADKVAQRMATIVTDLDTISKMEAGVLKLEYSSFEILQLINEVVESFDFIAQKENVEIAVSSFMPQVKVYADRNRIEVVLKNLIENAIKYKDKLNKKHSIKVAVIDLHDHIFIEVSDNGVGMAREHLTRIFERFYRVDRSRSREQGGSGLGLSIVKHILDAHGETIRVHSELHSGTSFVFTLSKDMI